MAVAVVNVWVVRVRVHQWLVRMPMGMRRRIGHRRVAGDMRMVVMLVVYVRVVMIQQLVPVLVFVALGKMQPDAERHQSRRPEKNWRGALAENDE